MSIYLLKNIETPRLLIRPVMLGDETAIYKAIQNTLSELQRWMPWADNPSFQTTLDFVCGASKSWRDGNSNDFPMVAIYKADQKIICATGFNEESRPAEGVYEIGYWLDKDFQGQGLVTELVNGLTRYALIAIKAQKVQICTQPENEKSTAVAKRCGFCLERRLMGHRIDCKTQQPADSLLFVCNSVLNLPQLEMSWV